MEQSIKLWRYSGGCRGDKNIANTGGSELYFNKMWCINGLYPVVSTNSKSVENVDEKP